MGRRRWPVLSCVVVAWRTHQGGSVPQVYTERSESPWVTLTLYVMRRYNLGGMGPGINISFGKKSELPSHHDCVLFCGEETPKVTSETLRAVSDGGTGGHGKYTKRTKK